MSTQDERDAAPGSDAVSNRATVERRRSIRIEVRERIEGHMRPFDVPITLVNVSRGGFLMQTPIKYGLGAIHEFHFTKGDDDPIALRARIVRGGGSAGQYQFGLEFVERGTSPCEEGIESLIAWLQGE